MVLIRMALGALALAVGLIAALVLRSAQLLRRATGTVAGVRTRAHLGPRSTT